MTFLIPLIPLLPLLGFAITGLLGRQMGRRSHTVAVWAVVATWMVAMVVAFGARTHSLGFGEAGGVPPSYAIISDYFPPGRRGMALGLP